MKRVFVTGLSGFVGQHMRRELASSSSWKLLEPGVEYDISERAQLDRALCSLGTMPDAVLHMAAQSNVPTAFRNPEATLRVNLFGTLHLLQSLRDAGFNGRFVYVGTADAYGLVAADELPVREDRPLRPRNPYAVSKAAAELLVYQWVQTEGLDAVMLRPFNHVGPGQDERFVVGAMARQVADIAAGLREPVLEVGDIEVTRDFTDVRDVVRAYRLVLDQGVAGEVYNVGSGRELSVRSILEQLLAIAGIDAEIRISADRLRPFEQRRVRADIGRIYRDTGWTPSIELDESLRAILTTMEGSK